MIDTGSSNLAVAGTQMNRTIVSPRFNPSLSNTSVDRSVTVSEQYLRGSWSGVEFADMVGLPNVPQLTTTAPFVVIAQQDGQSPFFVPGNLYQGIWGMAFPALAAGGITPFFDVLVQTRGVSNVFALQLCASSGQLWLGGYDAAYYTGPLSWASVVAPFYYAIVVSDILLGTVSIGMPTSLLSPDGAMPIVDSGTTMLLLNPIAYLGLEVTLLTEYPFINSTWLNGDLCMTDARYGPDSIALPIAVVIPTQSPPGGTYRLTIPSSAYILTLALPDAQPCFLFGVGSAGNIVLGQMALQARPVPRLRPCAR